MRIDGVFAGGGVKAFAFLGAMEVMEERRFQFERTAGTSAGALMAALVQAGYTAEELKSILLSLEVSDLLQKTKWMRRAPWLSWLSVYWKLGLYKGDTFEQWVKGLLAEKNIYTFRDLPKGSLRIVASDISSGKMMVLPDDLEDYGYNPDRFPVALAVRMSCMLPYFFEPVKLKSRQGKKHIIVDGGILSNFPIWLYRDPVSGLCKRPVIGFQLSPSLKEMEQHKINNAVELYQSLFDTMRKAHDLRYMAENDAQNVVFLPIEDVKTTNFDLTIEQKEKLINIGRTETKKFLKTWKC
ncbi:NTE family protein [Alteribacillus persepolensis]|uniref:NTE family protein n=1 Tax=Alteribacillus persepolensis TaxID=568899 RepID=A0A1G8CYI2_9BACI|nr:patatin-like phospholipase family protein [Alteribacillus persepolensis]SDH50545.1 NTE family protein [Alteribacillus persepolensis]